MRNNKGYVLVEIVLAFAITFTLIYFIMDLVISMKSKNDDIMVETLVKTDQAIITNKLMSYAIEEKENFDCNDLKSNITDKVVKYDGNTMDIVNDYSYIDIDNVSCKIEFGKINIVIPIEVRQMKDKNYDVVIDYKYDIGDQIPPTCSLSVDATGVINATYSDSHAGSSGINYYGWNSSLSGVTSSEIDITGEDTYTFYVTDNANNMTTCSMDVKNTRTSYYCPNYGSPPNCYYSVAASSRNSCLCSNGYYMKSISNMPDAVACAGNCANYGYTNSDFSVKYECDSGTLDGTNCLISEYSVVNYLCDDYDKINNSYCYKIS